MPSAAAGGGASLQASMVRMPEEVTLVLSRCDAATLHQARRVCKGWRRSAQRAVAIRTTDLSLGLEPIAVGVANEIDPWVAPFPSAEYLPRCDGSDASMRLRLRDAEAAGCDCVGGCGDGCSCLSHCTVGVYDEDGRLNLRRDAARSHQAAIVECSTLCKCDASCRNRVVGRGLRRPLVVVRTADRGWGVRTVEALCAGEFVCEYAGELLSGEERARRQRELEHEQAGASGELPANYLMSVREHLSDGRVLLTHIDPTRRGNVGRYINHSCAPNLRSEVARVGSLVPRLAFFAAADVPAGTELTFDYGGRDGQCPGGGSTEQGGEADGMPKDERLALGDAAPRRRRCR